MTPTNFPQSNFTLNPANGQEDLVQPIPACRTTVSGGPFDGQDLTIVAWQPTPEERERIYMGASIFLIFFGQIPPHTITTEFPT